MVWDELKKLTKTNREKKKVNIHIYLSLPKITKKKTSLSNTNTMKNCKTH